MRFALPALVLCLIPCTGILAQQPAAARADSQVLVPSDSTRTWQYPYQVSRARRELIVTVLRAFHDSCDVRDLVRQLGAPAQIEELSRQTAPQTAFEQGLLAGARGRRIYRLVWYVKKLNPTPSITDSFMAAYVRSDGRTVRLVRGYGLD